MSRHNKADFWTTINYYGNLLIKPVINTIAMGLAIDHVAGYDSQEHPWPGISHIGVGIGCVLAAICVFGESSAHQSLNSHHQEEEDDDDEKTEMMLVPGLGTDELVPFSINSSANLTNYSLSIGSPEEYTIQTHNTHSNNKKICGIKKSSLVLIGDFMAHAFDVNGSLTIAYHVLNPSMNISWLNMTVQIFIFGLSSISSIAEVRTCKHHLEHDHHEQKHLQRTFNGRPDFWTAINFPIEFLTIFLNNLVYMGTIIDNSAVDPDIADLSRLALYTGIIWGIVVALPTAYCHYRLNLNNQEKHSHKSAMPSNLEKIVILRYLRIVLDFSSHTIERASPLSSTLKLMISPKKPVLNLSIMFITTTFCAPIARADARTCAVNMKK